MKNYPAKSFLALLAGILVGAVTALAQEVIAPIPSAPAVPSAMQPFETPTPNVVANALGLGSTGAPIQWGFADFRPRVDYLFTYGNGVETAPGVHTDTIVQQLSPGLTLDVGDHFTFDYSPTWTFYSSPLLTNTLDHTASLAWGTAYDDWVLHASQTYSTESGPQVETAGQTSETSFGTSLDGSYRFSEPMSVDLSLSQTLLYVAKLQNSKVWSNDDWLNYQFAPTLTCGLGLSLGYVYLNPAPDETYEDYSARVTWKVTGKIYLTIHGGVEDRQTPQSLINPTFGATIRYEPFAYTALVLDAARQVEASYFEGQVTETTSLSVSLTQRFLSRFFLTVNGGYSNARYITVDTGGAPRSDDYYTFGARLSTNFLTRGTIAATYNYSDDASSLKSYSFTSNQIGCEVGYRF